MTEPAGGTQGLITLLDEYLVKKAPFQIPDAGKEFLVRFGPWISIVLLILSLPALLFAFGIGAFFIPFGGVGYATGFGIVAIFAIVQIAMLVMALPGLFARKMYGWTLLFYEQLVSFVGSIAVGSIVGGLLGLVIGLYILFQVREKYAA